MAGKGRDKVVELFETRAEQYAELAKKADDDFRDTVEMAEQTGPSFKLASPFLKGRFGLFRGVALCSCRDLGLTKWFFFGMAGGVIEGGTWEHRKRAQEMLKTADQALDLTLLNKGKHHIASFLPKVRAT